MIGPTSRNQLCGAVLVVDASGAQIREVFVDLRERVTPAEAEDQLVDVTSYLKDWGLIGATSMGDARFWWAAADISNVVDPFELDIGDEVAAPTQGRLLFNVLAPQNRKT